MAASGAHWRTKVSVAIARAASPALANHASVIRIFGCPEGQDFASEPARLMLVSPLGFAKLPFLSPDTGAR